MRLLKWIVFFVFSFLVSWTIIATLSQVPFSMTAPAKVVIYRTPEFPMYAYIIGSFALGLLIGLGIALYNFIYLRSGAAKHSHKARELEDEVRQLKAKLEMTRESEYAPAVETNGGDEEETFAEERLLDEDRQEENGHEPRQQSGEGDETRRQ